MLERLRSGSDASTPSYHFICEAFFLTARGLHLGLVKMIQDLYNIARVGGPACMSFIDGLSMDAKALCSLKGFLLRLLSEEIKYFSSRTNLGGFQWGYLHRLESLSACICRAQSHCLRNFLA